VKNISKLSFFIVESFPSKFFHQCQNYPWSYAEMKNIKQKAILEKK